MRLNEAYKGLWRIILLVHPKYERDVIGLSKAVDTLLLAIWPSVDISSVLRSVLDAAWFLYIPQKHRPAAVNIKISSRRKNPIGPPSREPATKRPTEL